MKKTKVLCLVLAVMLAFSLVGCGSSASTDTPAADSSAKSDNAGQQVSKDVKAEDLKEDKEINLTYMASTTDLTQDTLGCVYVNWVKDHPNVNLELQTMDTGETAQKILTLANADNLPNIFWATATTLTSIFNSDTEAANSALDLKPYLSDEFMSKVSEDAFDMLHAANGAIMGFPVYTVCQGFTYNKALFEKYGLEIPETYDDLVECVKVFKANDIVTIATGSKDTWDTWGYIFWQQLWGFEEQSEQVFGDNSIKYQDSDQVESFYRLAELAELGAFPENCSTLDYDQCCAMFGSGQAAMITSSSGQIYRLNGCEVADDCVFDWSPIFTDSPYDQNIGIRMSSNGYGVGAANTDEDQLAAIIALNEARFEEDGIQAALEFGVAVPGVFTADMIDEIEAPNLAKQQLKGACDDSIKAVKTTMYTLDRIWGQYEGRAEFEHTGPDYLMWGIIDGTFTKEDIPREAEAINDKIVDIITIVNANK